jgi:spore germination protein GerM
LPTTTTTQPSPSSLVSFKIYLVGSNQALVAVQRLVPFPAPLTSVLSSLIVGPTSSEAVGGTTTAIPSSVHVLSVTTLNNVVTVNFNAAFAGITGAATELAVSQVVATVAAQNGFDTGVIFEIGGVRTAVPTASGAEVLGPVYALQFITAPKTTSAVATVAPATP